LELLRSRRSMESPQDNLVYGGRMTMGTSTLTQMTIAMRNVRSCDRGCEFVRWLGSVVEIYDG
jgi:hypothetical protein